MCIDYCVVNEFIKLSNYRLPLIDDLLIGFDRAMWFMSLYMASGLWDIRMTERAYLISAFGHFQWMRMPLRLKNATMLSLKLHLGFRTIPSRGRSMGGWRRDGDPSEHNETEREESARKVPTLTDRVTVFKRNILAQAQM